MKSLTLSIALILCLACSAAAATLPPTPENIRIAQATPSDAKQFALCTEPSGRDTDKPGDVVFVHTGDKVIQYGSSLTPREAYALYCIGGN